MICEQEKERARRRAGRRVGGTAPALALLSCRLLPSHPPCHAGRRCGDKGQRSPHARESHPEERILAPTRSVASMPRCSAADPLRPQGLCTCRAATSPRCQRGFLPLSVQEPAQSPPWWGRGDTRPPGHHTLTCPSGRASCSVLGSRGWVSVYPAVGCLPSSSAPAGYTTPSRCPPLSTPIFLPENSPWHPAPPLGLP